MAGQQVRGYLNGRWRSSNATSASIDHPMFREFCTCMVGVQEPAEIHVGPRPGRQVRPAQWLG